MKHQIIIENGFAHLKNELENAIEWGEFEVKQKELYADAVFMVNGKKLYVETKNEIRPIQVEHLNERKKSFWQLTGYCQLHYTQCQAIIKGKGN